MPSKRGPGEKGYAKVSKEEEDTIYNDEPAGLVPGAPKTQQKKARTPKQSKWWKILTFSLVADMVVSVMIYETTHAFAAPFDLGVGAGTCTTAIPTGNLI